MQFILKMFFNFKTIGLLYLILYIYNNLLGVYPRIIFYHMRASMEWLSGLIPISTQLGIITLLVSISLIFIRAKKII